MDALLEFRGREFAVDCALADSPWRGHAKVWHHGEVTGKRSRRVCEDSGFNLRIGGSGDAELEQQIARYRPPSNATPMRFAAFVQYRVLSRPACVSGNCGDQTKWSRSSLNCRTTCYCFAEDLAWILSYVSICPVEMMINRRLPNHPMSLTEFRADARPSIAHCTISGLRVCRV